MDSVAQIILKQRHIPAPGLQLSTYVRLLALSKGGNSKWVAIDTWLIESNLRKL